VERSEPCAEQCQRVRRGTVNDDVKQTRRDGTSSTGSGKDLFATSYAEAGQDDLCKEENKQVVTVLFVCRVHAHVPHSHADAPSLKSPHRTSVRAQGVPPIGRVALKGSLFSYKPLSLSLGRNTSKKQL
jgi:hypothetical protein